MHRIVYGTRYLCACKNNITYLVTELFSKIVSKSVLHVGLNLSLQEHTMLDHPSCNHSTQHNKPGIMKWFFEDRLGTSYYVIGQ
jgi:hypothetical protein